MELQILPTEPHTVAADTFLIPTLAAEPSGAYVGAHSLVIRGAEPGPVLRGDRMGAAFAATAALAGQVVPATPDQSMLDAVLAAALGTGADVAA